jgi:hypothetical protein
MKTGFLEPRVWSMEPIAPEGRPVRAVSGDEDGPYLNVQTAQGQRAAQKKPGQARNQP